MRGRSPCGERGLKYSIGLTHDRVQSRSPCGERGLKYNRRSLHSHNSRRSPCGERGLKSLRGFSYVYKIRRSPCGERGLKFRVCEVELRRFASLPLWGAWIEIYIGAYEAYNAGVAPLVGSGD